MNWYNNRRRKRRQKQIDAFTVRVEGLTAEIEALDSDVYELEYDELLRRRAYAAWKRSDLLLAIYREEQK